MSKKLTLIVKFALLIVLVGQVSALPAPAALPNPEALPVPKRLPAYTDAGGNAQWEWRLQEKELNIEIKWQMPDKSGKVKH